MLTDSSLAALKSHLSATPDHAGTLDALLDTIAAQSALVRAMSVELRAHAASRAALERIMSARAAALAENLPAASRTDFSLAQAESACADLAAQTARAADPARILAAIVRVAAAFV